MHHRSPSFAAAKLHLVTDDMPPDPRKPGSRGPHRNDTVVRVRKLVETTPMTYKELSERTGIARSTICRWTRDAGWKRHLFAPRANDTVPTERASARLKLRTLAARIAAQAERAVRALEEAPNVDLHKLGEALALYNMAKFATLPRKRGRYRVPLRREWDPNIDRPDQRDFPDCGYKLPRKRRGKPLSARPRESRDPGDTSTEPEALDSRSQVGFSRLAHQNGGHRVDPMSARGNERSETREYVHDKPLREGMARGLRVLCELQAAGVDLDYAPEGTVVDYVESTAYEEPALRPRRNKTRKEKEREWLHGPWKR